MSHVLVLFLIVLSFTLPASAQNDPLILGGAPLAISDDPLAPNATDDLAELNAILSGGSVFSNQSALDEFYNDSRQVPYLGYLMNDSLYLEFLNLSSTEILPPQVWSEPKRSFFEDMLDAWW